MLKKKSVAAIIVVIMLIIMIPVILFINKPNVDNTEPLETPELFSKEPVATKEEEPVVVNYEKRQKEMLATSTFEWIQYETIANGYDMSIELPEDYFGKNAETVDLNFGELKKIGAIECASVSVIGVENCNYTLAYLSSTKNLIYVSDNDTNEKIVDHLKTEIRDYFVDGELYEDLDKDHEVLPGIIAKLSKIDENIYNVNVFSDNIEISKYQISLVPDFRIEELSDE